MTLEKLIGQWLFELENSWFEVVLVKAPEPRHSTHRVRMLQSANPEWYSRFAAEHVSLRGRGLKRMKRPRTYIKRENTIAALKRILNGDRSGVYGERLVNFAERELRKIEMRSRPPRVRAYDDGFRF